MRLAIPSTRRILAVALLTLSSAALSAPGHDDSLAIRESFRIGSGGVLCTAQSRPLDPEAHGMFDRAYAIACRDAAAEVGKLYALRGADLGALLARRADTLECRAPAPGGIDGLAGVQVSECTRRGDALPYRYYAVKRGDTLFVAEGLFGYDSALTLGLRALVADRPVDGNVEVAVTQAGDPAAFARIQAGMLDPQGAMNEGYLRNNAGSFAEAAAFFGALVDGSAAADGKSGEYLLNAGLQQSNLGNAPAAELAFRQAELRGVGRDPVMGRMLRNYRTMALLNQRDAEGALAMVARPVPAVPEAVDAALAQGTITPGLSDRLNRGDSGSRRLGAIDGRLQPWERAQILDGQAALLRGSAQRIEGHDRAALASFAEARDLLLGVRGGRVASAGFLQSEVLAESALAEETLGEFAAADRDFAAAVSLVEISYPRSAAVLIAKARLAGYRARRGDTDGARALYAEVVADSAGTADAATLRGQLGPYFTLLAARAGKDSQAAAEMFAANQVLVAPGLAQTQAVLARELSAGNDEAARLFRDALDRSRDVSRAAGEVAELAGRNPAEGTSDAVALAQARDRLHTLEQEQVAVQARLSQFPRYRVLDNQGLSLADLQKALRPGEAYYEMRIVGQDAYAVFVTPGEARAFRIDASASALAADVAELRDSIVRIEDRKFVTEPFKLALAHRLYTRLFGPVAEAMQGVDHLIYEPDGALRELPANLLVTDQASIDRYEARAAASPFDFTGTAWLGRGRDVTTAVSPRAFVDVRNAPPSHASRAYIGLGHNAQPDLMASFLAPTPPARTFDRCAWPIAAWKNPISAAELTAARDYLGGDSTVVTDAAFSDTAIAARGDMASYRVVHFATHGLVTAPRPECPARPALLTSFGDKGSDGLLSFREIYDLRLDADLVVLSACDTAGMATIEATREAGVETGGNFALDGLVRAFVAAGARSVVASHWPVPDDYQATQKLVLGMIGAAPGTPVATALRKAETALMDDPATSHPYYWAAFAVVGDGERPLSTSR